MTKKLNIGIVANTAFNIYNFRLGLIRALQEEGHHVVAIAPPDTYVSILKEKGIRYIEVGNLSRKGTNPFNDLRLVNELRKIYKDEKLDAVLQYTIKPNIYGTLAARLTGTKAICTVTGLGYTFLNKSMASGIAHRLYRLAFTSAYKVLFQNEDDLRTFLENDLVDIRKTGIVPGSGIDTEQFSPSFCQPQKRDGITRFLMIGRLLKDKGVYEYIEAAKNILRENKNVEFHLLGEIDYNNPSAIKKEELQDWIDKKLVHYHLYAKDTRPFICMSDCIVLPSYREGMPRVILEGMAMGKPCISSDAPGCKDAVEDGETGYLCKTADADSLTDALKHFLGQDDTHKNKLGLNGRKRIENLFSNEKISSTYLLLIRNLV